MTTTADLRHGANVLRALARNLDALTDAAEVSSPLDHPSARDALTVLAWRGELTSETLQFALDLSQPACVRVVDRLEDAGLVVRHRPPGDRRVRIALTEAGERAAAALVRASGRSVERLLGQALTEDELSDFVAALDRVAATMFGDARDTARFCRACDVSACLGGARGCPSDETCRSNVAVEV